MGFVVFMDYCLFLVKRNPARTIPETTIHSGSGEYVVLLATGAVVGTVDPGTVTEVWTSPGEVMTPACRGVGAGVNVSCGRNMTLAEAEVFPEVSLTPADAYDSCM